MASVRQGKQASANDPASAENAGDVKKPRARDKVKPKPSNARTVFLKNKIKSYYKTAEEERHSVFGSRTCRDIRLFVASFSLLLFTVGAIRQYNSHIMGHIQRHFSITAMEQNFLIGVEKIGIVIMLVFAAYYGNKMSKPIAIFSGAMFCAFGTILWAVPYFLELSRGYNTTHSDKSSEIVPTFYDVGLCQIGRNSSAYMTQCEVLTVHPNKTEAYSIIATGNFLSGVGTSFLMTLGFIYIEESVEKNIAPLYYGIILGVNSFGEIIGLIMAWQLTSLSIHQSGDLGLAEWDIGSWWIGFPVFASMFFIFSFPLLFFPKWISEPNWLLSRRHRKLARTLNLIRIEEKALIRLEKKKNRKKQKQKEKQKRKIRKQEQEQGAETDQEVEASQVNLAYEQDNEEDDTATQDETIANGHTSENGTHPDVIPNDDEADEEDQDGADDPIEDNTDTPAGSNMDISSSLQTDLDRITGKQDTPAMTTDRSASRVHFDVEPVQEDAQVDNVLQMEEPNRDQTTGDDSSSMKSENSSKSARRKRQHKLGRRIQDLPNNIWFLINRPVFIITVVGSVFAAYSNFGFRPTLHTYEHAQFPAYSPPNYVSAGLPSMIGTLVGVLVSACVLYNRPSNITLHIKAILILQAIVIVLYLIMMAPHCDPGNFTSPTTSNATFSLKVDCNDPCDCSGSQYNRVCSRSGVMFPSPCHGGCRNVKYMETHNALEFSRCSCISEFKLSPAYCNFCTSLRIGYETLSFLVSLSQSMGYVSLLVIFLRCISQKLRSLALGFAIWIIYLASAVPGVAVYGAFQDLACVVQREDCFEEKRCWQFKLDTYRYLQNGATCAFQVVAFIFYLAVYLVLRQRAKTMLHDKNGNKNTVIVNSNNDTTA